jgi:hypothetical protein
MRTQSVDCGKVPKKEKGQRKSVHRFKRERSQSPEEVWMLAVGSGSRVKKHGEKKKKRREDNKKEHQ